MRAFAFAAVLSSVSASSVHMLFGKHLSPGAQIIAASDSNWTQDVQQRWSTWYAPKYRAAIKVATASDVQSIVRIASAYDIPFLATAAGHGCSETYAGVHDGIDIDISRLNHTNFDPATDLLTIGGATKFQPVWDALQPYGKELPTGSAQCVGTMGAALGAGIGPLQGHRGLMLDALESAKMVIANGSLVTTSRTQNPDLFWAIRGAGFNFGIVTEATFKVFNATFGGQVMEGDMLFPGSANGSFWEVFKSFDDDAKLDPKLSLVAALSYSHETNESAIVLNSNFYGPNETLQEYLKPFLALKPIQSNFTLVPWNKLYASLFFGSDVTSCQSNQHLAAGGEGLRQTDVGDYIKFTNDFQSFSRIFPTVNSSFVASRFSSKAPLSVPDAEAAYPYRDIKTHLLFENIYPDEPGMDEAVGDFVVQARKTFQPGSGYKNLTMYLNYNKGDEGPEVWYSPAKLGRLSKLKREWDPKERFSFNCPVPLHYP